MKKIQFWIAFAFVFMAPICVAVAFNWDAIKPYIIVDAEDAKGRVMYFYADS